LCGFACAKTDGGKTPCLSRCVSCGCTRSVPFFQPKAEKPTPSSFLFPEALRWPNCMSAHLSVVRVHQLQSTRFQFRNWRNVRKKGGLGIWVGASPATFRAAWRPSATAAGAAGRRMPGVPTTLSTTSSGRKDSAASTRLEVRIARPQLQKSKPYLVPAARH
jgi:hypothetical protein